MLRRDFITLSAQLLFGRLRRARNKPLRLLALAILGPIVSRHRSRLSVSRPFETSCERLVLVKA
jgi:hypothetical protein